MRIEAISIGRNPPDEVNVIIEVPVGGEPIKYELDKEAGTLIVDRFLYTSMRYPGNYGFIPHTLSGDGDPVDVLVANQRGIVPGAVMAVRPVGVFLMQDEAGLDEKIVAVPMSRLTRRYDQVSNYTDFPEITVKQIEHFFAHYKDLEDHKWVKVLGLGERRSGERLHPRRHRPRQDAMNEQAFFAQRRPQVRFFAPPTKSRASRARATHDASSPSSSTHSFIRRPWPGSNGRPFPSAVSSSTRARGSLATNRPRDEIIANSFPFTLSPDEPNPLLPSP